MNNAQLIEKFYTSFRHKDWNGMQSCYADDITFSDPVFPLLKGKEAKAMWHMLVSASKDLEISFNNIVADDKQGSCHWEAIYTFSKTGRKVHNKIDAQFRFKDGLIIQHTDSFDLWRWSRMALGTSGIFLGWSPLVKNKIRSMASKNLESFIGKNSDYQ
ncbi:MAG: nuclear transport factor 2 family protein [Cyclobacteriaceae bacterium]|nr:nuclear transport factor 2 family protein [Cyclobacteriaceae bacterium]